MRIKVVTLLACAALFCGYAEAQEIGELEVTISYNRQEGRGSNQYAVWIENASGELIKTLYVTNYTARGGYETRPDALPAWVSKANPAGMSEAMIDGITGATPSTGEYICMWDGTDLQGSKVAPGTYRYVVEGTYSGPNRVLFNGVFNTADGKKTYTPEPEFNSDEPENRNMLAFVIATYNP